MRVVVPKVIKDARNKPPFDFDCLTQIRGVDPLVALVAEFPWQEVLARLDGPEPHNEKYRKAAGAMKQLLAWMVEGRDLSRIGVRAAHLLFILCPQERRDNPALLRTYNRSLAARKQHARASLN